MLFTRLYFLSLKVTACSHSHSAAVGTITQKTTGDSAPPSRQTSSAEQPAPRIVRFCLVLSRLVLLPALAAHPPPRERPLVALSSSTLLYFALLCSIFLYFSLFILIAIVRISLTLYVLLLLPVYTITLYVLLPAIIILLLAIMLLLLLLLLLSYYAIILLCYYYITIIVYYYYIILYVLYIPFLYYCVVYITNIYSIYYSSIIRGRGV